jgi:hypothetical protein
VVRAAAALLAAAGLAAAPLRVALTPPPAGHAPRVGARWPYSVRATIAGRPAHARLTAQIVDPLGGTHYVQFGLTTKTIRNHPFVGTFRDFIIWPKESRGIPLTLRLTVVAAGARRVVSYRVTPRT